jgi:pyruvate/2-oxoglutarate dehydrogenase complex dihydrolipoamide acyltransferase (E2) component
VAREFRLPDIGEGLVDAEIVKWHVSVGDVIVADQVVVEIETAKAVVEIPSPYAGTVLRLGAQEGETVDVGEVLIVVGEAGGVDVPDAAPPQREIRAAAAPAAAAEAAQPSAESSIGSSVRAMPIVRKMARDAGVDLTTVVGTGPGRAITRKDVEAHLSGAAAATAAAPAAAAGGDERIRMSRTRRTIAEHMERSWHEIPHVTTFHEVDGTRLIEARRALEGRLGLPIPIETLVIKAVLPALAEFPEFNATLDGEELVLHHRFDIGVAVDTPDGLIVPVVAGAGNMDVATLASRIAELADKAKQRKLAPAETQRATFTVTNIGAVGGTHGTPIIPHGTTAILSIGRARAMPTVLNGIVVPRTTLPVSLSFDHRVVDGALGQRFAARLAENISEPALFLAG